MPGAGRSWLWGSIIDILLLVAIAATAMALRVGWPVHLETMRAVLVIAPVAIVALPFIYFGFGLYFRKPVRLMVRSAVFAQGTLFLVVLAAAFWFRGFWFPRSVLAITAVIHLAAAIGWRWAVERMQHSRAQRVAVVASRDEAVAVVEKLLQEPPCWYDIVRVIDPDELRAEVPTALDGAELVVAGPSVVGEVRLALLEAARRVGARVFIMPELSDILMVGSAPGRMGDTPVFEIRSLSLSSRQLAMKRVFDLVLAVPMLVLLWPVMAVVAIAIKLFSPGPVLFTQKRIGLNGREFILYKFRTMVVDAESRTGPVFATANDPRVTPVGEFLRATRLDELPQLINVLRGEMSLVGPRPERPYFVEQFQAELPEFALRHLVPPGITGLAQVMGRYCTSPQDKLRFDLYYIRHYSIWLDLKILLLTLQAVISPKSATGAGADEAVERLRAEQLVLERSLRT